MESVAYTPRRVLEQIKGISEQKATKILGEGRTSAIVEAILFAFTNDLKLNTDQLLSLKACAYGLYHSDGNAPEEK